jgi:hypothetical protein
MRQTVNLASNDLPEVPEVVADSIDSWWRIVSGAKPEDGVTILRNATDDLFRTRTISKTVHPGSYGAINQAIVDNLARMARSMEIDDTDR